MKAQIVEQVELFSEAELESLEFVPEELEAIEAERVPDLDSISFEDIAEDLEAVLEINRLPPGLGNLSRLPREIIYQILERLPARAFQALMAVNPGIRALVRSFNAHQLRVLTNKMGRLNLSR